MQHQFVITIDDHVSEKFAIDFLNHVNFIKSVKPKTQKDNMDSDVDEITLMSESALGDEWLSEEDNRWDQVL